MRGGRDDLELPFKSSDAHCNLSTSGGTAGKRFFTDRRDLLDNENDDDFRWVHRKKPAGRNGNRLTRLVDPPGAFWAILPFQEEEEQELQHFRYLMYKRIPQHFASLAPAEPGNARLLPR